jgi:Coenzyme PQQ synthesis protein D (PqqD)
MGVKVYRNSAVDFAPMKSESVLFQPQTNQFCLLNGTATFLWGQLERPCTISEIAQKLCDHFDGVSLTDAIRDVEQTVNQLLSLNFLTSSQV